MFTRLKLTVPFTLVMPTIGSLTGGVPNPLYPLALFMNDNTPKNQKPVTDGSKLDRYSEGSNYIYHSEVDLTILTVELCGFLLQNGCEIEQYPLFAKVDPQASLPGEGEQPTWAEFFAATTTRSPSIVRTEEGEDWYVPTSVFGESYLPFSHSVGVFGYENLVSLVTLNELIANQPPEPEPEDEPNS
jgi:hypothetical protein